MSNVNANSFIGLAANGMKAIGTRGMDTACAVAVAIVWNDDIGPTLGQPKEKRNVLLGRLERRLIGLGMKVASLETWRKHGVKFATNYSANIENILNAARNDTSRNSQPTSAEYVKLVATWANEKFRNLAEFQADIMGRAKVERTDAEKAQATALAYLTTLSRKDGDGFLHDVAEIAIHRRVICDKGASDSAKIEAQAMVAAILKNYTPTTELAAQEEAEEAEREADANANVVTLAA